VPGADILKIYDVGACGGADRARQVVVLVLGPRIRGWISTFSATTPRRHAVLDDNLMWTTSAKVACSDPHRPASYFNNLQYKL